MWRTYHSSNIKLQELEDKRSVLLYLRNSTMKEALNIIQNMDKSKDEKRIIHNILDEHNTKVSDFSKALNLRESIVRKILSDIEKEFTIT